VIITSGQHQRVSDIPNLFRLSPSLAAVIDLITYFVVFFAQDESDVSCRSFIDNRGLKAFTSCVQVAKHFYVTKTIFVHTSVSKFNT